MRNSFELGGRTFTFTCGENEPNPFTSVEFACFHMIGEDGQIVSFLTEDEKKTAFNLCMAVNGQQPQDLTYLVAKPGIT